MPCPRRFEHQLDDLASIEVATHEFGVRLVLFQCHDGDVGGGHDGFAYRSDAGKEVLGEFGCWARQRFDEHDSVVRVSLMSIEALDADGHGYGGKLKSTSRRHMHESHERTDLLYTLPRFEVDRRGGKMFDGLSLV